MPGPRAGHTAAAVGERIYVFGGRGEEERSIEEMGRVWVFDTRTLGWSYLDPINDANTPPSYYLHGCVASAYPPAPIKATENASYAEQISSTISKIPTLVAKGPASQEPHGTLIIHGGLSASSKPNNETWTFNIATKTWSSLPSTSSSTAALPNIVLANDIIYVVSGSSDFANDIHTLPLKRQVYTNETGESQTDFGTTQEEWSTTTIPSNPLTPGPKARKGGALQSINTGAGRECLLYLMGEKASTSNNSTSEEKSPNTSDPKNEPVFFSDAWTYGLPPSSLTPAGFKDATRSTFGMSTSASTWSEVKVEANIEADAEEGASGKSHPGPRAWFAVDAVGKVVEGGRGGVIWGGSNGRGEVEGDGWVGRVG